MRMYKLLVCLFLIFQIALIASTDIEVVEPEICMYIFYYEDCESCEEIINEYLPQTLTKYQKRINIKYFTLDRPKNYEALIWFEEAYNITYEKPPVIIIGEYFLDYNGIKDELEMVLDKYSKNGIPFQKPDLINDAYYAKTPLFEKQIEKEEKVYESELPIIYLAYFYEIGCEECNHAEYQINYLQRENPNLMVMRFNMSDVETKRLSEALGELYKIHESMRMVTPSVFIGQDYLIGQNVNDMNLLKLIEKYKYKGAPPPWTKAENYLDDAEKKIIERFKGLEITTVLFAGLVDGVNPCAFVTIVFLISYLAIVGRKGRALLFIGLSFTSAVFITYFIIGLGFLKFIQSLSFMPILARIVYLLIATGAIVLGGLSIYDYVKYSESDYDESILKLPDFLQKKIHRVIREKVRLRNYLLAAFVTGFFISIMEFACTGQVYLPTIIFVTNIPFLKTEAILYLLIYNFCFILPLVFIFLLAYNGMTSEHLSTFWKKRGKTSKLLIAIVFFGLAGFLIYNIV